MYLIYQASKDVMMHQVSDDINDKKKKRGEKL